MSLGKKITLAVLDAMLAILVVLLLLLALMALGSMAQAQTNTHATNGTFSNSLSVGGNGTSSTLYNNRVYSDLQVGSSLDARVNACIALAKTLAPHICDASNDFGTIAAQINVGDSSFTPVTLFLPSGASWNVSISDGTSCALKQFGGTSIIGQNTFAGTNVGTHIIANTGSNMLALYCTDPAPSGGGAYVRAEGFTLDARNLSTMASGTVMLAQKLFDNSKFSDIEVLNYQPNTDGLTVYGACCGTKFDNITLNGNSTGGRELFVKADTNASNSSIAFYNLSAGHANGLPNIEISGMNGAGPTDATNRNINFYNTYSEFSNNANSVGVKIQDARGVHFYGLTTGVSGSFTGATGVSISQSTANQVRDIIISGYRYQSSVGGAGLVNSITGESLLASTGEITNYTYGGQSGAQGNLGNITSDLPQTWKDAAGDSVYSWPVSNNPAPVIKNFVDSIGTFNLDCGLTTAQSCIYQIKQLGVNAWGFGTDGGPNFIVVDRLNGKNVFHFAQSAARATTGAVNYLSTEQYCWRNNANSADVCISKNASDVIQQPATNFTGPVTQGGIPLAGGFTCVNVTPVTVNTNTASDQNLMACTIPAGTLNGLGKTLLIQLAGIYSTPAASSTTVNLKAKLCTVSGCGSGTVITLASLTSAALGAIQATNDPFNVALNSSTQTAGASASFEAHGNLTIDISALTSAAEGVYADGNTATVGTIDSTAQLFLQITGAFSSASASNSMSLRQLIADSVD